jgi:hypothetical protein
MIWRGRRFVFWDSRGGSESSGFVWLWVFWHCLCCGRVVGLAVQTPEEIVAGIRALVVVECPVNDNTQSMTRERHVQDLLHSSNLRISS